MRPTTESRRHFQLEFGVLTTLLFFCGLNAELNIVKTPSPIKALLGNNVTLPCVLTRDNNRQRDLDLSIVGVLWRKISSDGSEIDVYKFLSLTHEQDRPGSFIDERELRRGNASLTLYHVQRSDEGEYFCTIFVTPNRALTKINVQLLAQPDVTLSMNELTVELGSEKSITCEVNKYYPEVVKIRWVKYSKSSGNRLSLDRDTYFTVPEENSNGTFSITSLLIVIPSSLKETGDSYSCNVGHESLNHDQDIRFMLTVKEPRISDELIVAITFCALVVPIIVILLVLYLLPASPKISDITGLDDLVHDKDSTLSCMVSGFKPRNVEIQFCLKRVREPIEQVIDSWKYSKPPAQRNNAVDYSGVQRESELLMMHENVPSMQMKPLKLKRTYFTYSCLCFTHIKPDIKKDEDAELIIKVIHSALKSPLIKSETLKIKGDCLRLSPNTVIHPIHGEKVTLTCKITKYIPGPLYINWLIEDMKQNLPQIINMKGDSRYVNKKKEHQDGRRFIISQSLTFRANVEEDRKKKYICRVYYPALGQSKQSTFETQVRAVPAVTPITSKPAIPLPGQQMELSCTILKFYPQELPVEWYKENDLMPHNEEAKSIRDHGRYTVTSILKLNCELEDLGKTFRCKVCHESLDDPKIVEWTLNSLGEPLNNAEDEEPGATRKMEESEYEKITKNPPVQPCIKEKKEKRVTQYNQ